MDQVYIDNAGVKHDLQIFADTYNKQPYFRILRNGAYFLDITYREDGTWEELFNGHSERATEYGKVIEGLNLFDQHIAR
ncbi:hypothetical protein ACX0G7_09555 [Flavitalea antarctica]